jgi:DNA-binding winged helix-turn-helix (wHTH) protein/tetratricopeptide (TPR) repeat protein/TolB-like protein
MSRSEITSDRRRVAETFGGDGHADAVAARALAFGPYVADEETGRLLESGRVVALAPKPFETLYYLASQSGRVVPKTELMERLWPGTFVTDDVLVQCVVDIRRALHDPAKTPHYVQTVPRRGYQFLAPVREAEAADWATPPEALPPGLPEAADAPPDAPSAGARPRVRSWLIAASAVLAIGAAAVAFLRSRGPAAAVSSGVNVEPGSLLVMPMVVEAPTSENAWMGQGLAEMISAQLGQTPGIRVVARHRLAAALEEGGLDAAQGASPERASQVARGLHAEKIVSGSFVRVNDQFVLTAQVADVVSGRTDGTASVRGRYPADFLDSVDDLCLKLLHHLTPSPGPGAAGFRPARLATQSVEASRFYVEALSWQALGGRQGWEQAERRLDAALTLDPSFAQAYVKKAEIQESMRHWGYGNPDPEPAIRAASRLLKDLPDRDRLLVESFDALIVRRQPEVALERWSALLQFYPTYAQEAGVPQMVAATFANLGRWDQLILVGEAHVSSPSLPDAERARLSALLATAFRRKGEFARAVEHAQHAVELWPTREGPEFLRQRTQLARIAIEAGGRVEALANLRAVRDASSADATNLTDAAWAYYMAGERKEAAALIDRALTTDESYGNAYHLRGWLLLADGKYVAAADSLQKAFSRTPRAFGQQHQGVVGADMAALYYAGVAYQLNGEWEKGEPLLVNLIDYCREQQMLTVNNGSARAWQIANFRARAEARLGRKTEEPPRLVGDDTTYFVQTARLHAVQGRKQDALRELGQGLSLGHGELQHVRDDPDFLTLHDEPEWKRLTEGPGAS